MNLHAVSDIRARDAERGNGQCGIGAARKSPQLLPRGRVRGCLHAARLLMLLASPACLRPTAAFGSAYGRRQGVRVPLQDVTDVTPTHSCTTEGATVRLSCPDGQAITVQSATYGSPSTRELQAVREGGAHVCARWVPEGGYHDSATDLAVALAARGACDGRSWCTFGVSHFVKRLRDPAPGLIKLLRIVIVCTATAGSNNASMAKTVHQLGPADRRQWPKIWSACQRSWQGLARDNGMEYRFWSDDEATSFVREEYPDFYECCYSKYPKNIQRFDSVRYLILHRYGGLYADMDYEACGTAWVRGIQGPAVVASPY